MTKLGFYISSLQTGGAERVCVTLANHFAKIGYDVFISTSTESCTDFYQVSHAVKRIDNKYKFKSNIIHRIFDTFKKINIARNQILSEKPDYVFAFCTSEIIKHAIVKSFTAHKYKLIACEHNNYSAVKSKVRRYFRDWALTKSDIATVLTERDRVIYQEKGIKTIVIPNPVNQLSDNTIETKPKSLQQDKLKRILMVGRLTHQKGYDLLIPIVRELLSYRDDFIIDIFGHGEDFKRISDLISEYGFQERINLKGLSSNIKGELLDSDLFIMTSRWEGLPMTLIEASSNGVPIISYDCPTGPREILLGLFDNYTLVPVGDHERFAQNINYLLSNPDVYLSVSEKLICSSKRYSLDRVTSSWISVFRGLSHNE